MKLPPTTTNAAITVAELSHSAETATPAASTKAATAKARRMPQRAPRAVHSATEGAAARPNITQTYGSRRAIAGEPRTMATMKVAVMM